MYFQTEHIQLFIRIYWWYFLVFFLISTDPFFISNLLEFNCLRQLNFMINDGGKLGGCGCACKYSDLKRAESES